MYYTYTLGKKVFTVFIWFRKNIGYAPDESDTYPPRY